MGKEIGRGNFSIVHRAVHRQCGKAYAIKRSRRPLHSTADLQSWLNVSGWVAGHAPGRTHSRKLEGAAVLHWCQRRRGMCRTCMQAGCVLHYAQRL